MRIVRVFIILIIAGLILGTVPFVFADEIDWQEKRSDHFIVYSAPEVEKGYVNETINTAEGYYHSLEDKLGFRRFDYWTWEDRVKIYIYPDRQSYVEATGRPGWSGGSVDLIEKTINSFAWEGHFFDRLLPHELAHIVFREYIGTEASLPLWLDEGFAGFNEKNYYRRYVIPVIQLAIRDKGFNGLEVLNGFTQQGLHYMPEESAAVSYCYSVSLVHYLWQAFGKDKFHKFCQAAKEKRGNHIENALLEVYRFKDQTELGESWLDYLLYEIGVE